MFRVEVSFDGNLKKGEIHPVYKIRYLLHRKITVEEPRKRNAPVQCMNCQEFGHTKSFCTLPSVCVICGDLHKSSNCNKAKNDDKIKKCSNCGGDHTANYRGCPVFTTLKRNLNPNWKQSIYAAKQTTKNFPEVKSKQGSDSYASVVKSNGIQHATNDQMTAGTDTLVETLINTLNNFMSSMQNTLQELVRNQNMLMQILISKP